MICFKFWQSFRTIAPQKPRLLRVGGRWYCATWLKPAGSLIMYDHPCGVGHSATEAYWHWKVQ